MMSTEDREILAFEENLVSIRDFEDKVSLLVGNLLEKFSFLKSAQEQKVAFTFYLHEKNDKKFDNWVKFSSYLFTDAQEALEIEINKGFYKRFKEPHVFGVFFLNNIKVVFESQVLKVTALDETTLSMNIGMPIRMIRYQRRDSFRVKLPPFTKISIDLNGDPTTPYLNGLKILNISIGGAAVLLNTNVKIENIPQSFPAAKLHLENETFDNIKIKVKRIIPFNSGAIPLNIAAQKEKLGWYEMALIFEKPPTRVQQEIFFLVNTLSKKTIE